MPPLRNIYLVLLVATVVSGILSRRVEAIPMFFGDILWALMVYLIIRFVFINRTLQFAVVGSLLFSYSIECSQLYQAPWINEVRGSWLGHMVLGAGFLFSDLLCYTVGIAFGACLDKWVLQKLYS